MKLLKNIINNQIYFCVIVVFLYIFGIIVDVPFIRGFYDPVFPSEWPYYYVNTWNKVWAPIVSFGFVLYLFVLAYMRYDNWNIRRKRIFWIGIISSVFVLHLSYVFFSRFGLTVLFQRIVNPGMNGYVSSAVKIETLDYLQNFPKAIEELDQHARDHPPGSILFIKGVMYSIDKFGVSSLILPFVPTPDGDVRQYWDVLKPHERVSALILSGFYHFTGALAILPIFFIGSLYFDTKKSLSLAFLGGLIPSVSFFALKFDTFYFLTFLFTAYFFILNLKNQRYYFISGFMAFLCTIFSYSIIPALGVLGVYYLIIRIGNLKLLMNEAVKILIGFLIPLLALLIIGYNSFSAFWPIVANQAPRSYLQWLLYNSFDFFQYFGVALSVLFFAVLLNNKAKSDIKKLMYVFMVLFAVLVISGISRAEVGRIWMPLMFFPLISIGLYQKLHLRFVLLVGLLLFIQNIIMTEFWVPIW